MLQQQALEILKQGHNVFLTGCAGSGKTYTLNQYCAWLKTEEKLSYAEIALTASTGIAATHINGRTIHSWSGIGIHKEIEPQLIKKITHNKNILQRIKMAKVLVIDEISMLHRKQFELIEEVICRCRNSNQPFGGLQVIICGDFFQLPPIPTQNKQETDEDLFCFNSPVWQKSDLKVCYLTEQYRSKVGQLNEILNAVRIGAVTPMHRKLLSDNSKKIYDDQRLHLVTHTKDADELNKKNLDAIQQPLHQFIATTQGDPDLVRELLKSVLAPEELDLKVGAKVLFVKNNLDQGYVNGTQGIVVEFKKDANDQSYPVVETHDKKRIKVFPMNWEILDDKETVIASFRQTPLILAWAITIHKSQGMSLNEANVDLRRTFVNGQGYVAISRLTDISGLYLMGASVSALNLNPSVKYMDVEFQRQSQMSELLLQSQHLDPKNDFFDFLIVPEADLQHNGKEINFGIQNEKDNTVEDRVSESQEVNVNTENSSASFSSVHQHLRLVQIENTTLETRLKTILKQQACLNAADAYAFLQLNPKIDGIGAGSHARAKIALKKLYNEMLEDPIATLKRYQADNSRPTLATSTPCAITDKAIRPPTVITPTPCSTVKDKVILPSLALQQYLERIPTDKILQLERRVINKLLEHHQLNALAAYMFLQETSKIQGLSQSSIDKAVLVLKELFNQLAASGEMVVQNYIGSGKQVKKVIEVPKTYYFDHSNFNIVSEFDDLIQFYTTKKVDKIKDSHAVITQRYGFYGEPKTLEDIANFLGQASKSAIQRIRDETLKGFDRFLTSCQSKSGYYLAPQVCEQYTDLKARIQQLYETRIVVTDEELQHLYQQTFGNTLKNSHNALLLEMLGYTSTPKKIKGFRGRTKSAWLKKADSSLYQELLLTCNLLFNQPLYTEFFDLVVACRKSITFENVQLTSVLQTIEGITINEDIIKVDINDLNLGDQLYLVLHQLGASQRIKTIQTKLGQLTHASVHSLTSEETIRNKMSADQRFQPQGKSGLWSLKEHNIVNQSILEAIQSVLIRVGYALNLQDLIKEVQIQRPDAAINSISVYLANRDIFTKSPDGLYGLAMWSEKKPTIVKKNQLDDIQLLEDFKTLFLQRSNWENAELKHLLADKYQVDAQTIHTRLKKLNGVERVKKGITDLLICHDPDTLHWDKANEKLSKGMLIQTAIRDYLQQFDPPQAQLMEVKKYVCEHYLETIPSTFYHYLDKMDDVQKINIYPISIRLVS